MRGKLIVAMKVSKSPHQLQRMQENWSLCVFLIIILSAGERIHSSRSTGKRYSSQLLPQSLETLKKNFKTTAKGRGEAKQQDLLQGTSVEKDDYSSWDKNKEINCQKEKESLLTHARPWQRAQVTEHIFKRLSKRQRWIPGSRICSSEDEQTLMIQHQDFFLLPLIPAQNSMYARPLLFVGVYCLVW